MWIEVLVVLVLTLLNGLLAMSELAIVSARPARLKVLAERGDRGAATALALGEEPGRFLSSVQIGITLVGILSGAFSGATLGARLAAALPGWGVPASLAQPLGMGGVVVAITYLSLIVGELVPKQLALKAPERVAVRVAPLMLAISRGAAPLVWLLDRSGKLVLAALGQSGEDRQTISDEEIKLVISEAETAGVMHRAETEMIAGVMRIADRSARGLMTPRREIEAVDVGDSWEEMARKFRDGRRTRLPVSDGDPNNLIGVIASVDLMSQSRAEAVDLRQVMQPAPIIPETMDAPEVIARLRAAPGQMLLVYDEYGHFEGVVTPMDVLEAITGEFAGLDDDEPKLVERDDGSLLVAGWMPVDEFADRLSVPLDEDRDFSTVAGLVLDLAGRLPQAGDRVDWQGWRIEVVDMDHRRIDKLLVQRLPL
ncbi:hemolysin family protein [Paracoccus sp. P2]|uniref:Hemolysin n=1 Tax=Paracoccus pantotrophus TaxID=82367 RepID=A0A1I5JLR4_PARPN|nr:hemolysin family protein [Paracoccus pantotrophus]MDF3853480.1 hemolysin family protein [Paracoccus pantotrophus]QFG38002.1 HlyC/CorC family transporter [Paracoccus pantotrophus]QLH15558.1 HlyC/CorC family transporter [Paracoccus pantotrophus]RDD96817.1 HlyC/CorC family transporter [Paracoccus pantotrophus]RKS51510.1 putative hemolysin [Paracoccus pantotrophus]